MTSGKEKRFESDYNTTVICIAEENHGYKIAVIDLINPIRSDGNRLLNLTDMSNHLIVESVYGGFITNYTNQELCLNIITHPASIQQGEIKPKDLRVATRTEIEKIVERGKNVCDGGKDFDAMSIFRILCTIIL